MSGTASLAAGSACFYSDGYHAVMTAHRLLVIARRFRGPPTSGNGGYTCGMLAAAASGPVEVRLVKPPPLDKRLEILDEPATGGLRLMDGPELVATATPKSVEL